MRTWSLCPKIGVSSYTRQFWEEPPHKPQWAFFPVPAFISPGASSARVLIAFWIFPRTLLLSQCLNQWCQVSFSRTLDTHNPELHECFHASASASSSLVSSKLDLSAPPFHSRIQSQQTKSLPTQLQPSGKTWGHTDGIGSHHQPSGCAGDQLPQQQIHPFCSNYFSTLAQALPLLSRIIFSTPFLYFSK